MRKLVTLSLFFLTLAATAQVKTFGYDLVDRYKWDEATARYKPQILELKDNVTATFNFDKGTLNIVGSDEINIVNLKRQMDDRGVVVYSGVYIQHYMGRVDRFNCRVAQDTQRIEIYVSNVVYVFRVKSDQRT